MTGLCFATFRSLRLEPPRAACNCAALVLAPLAPTIINRRIKMLSSVRLCAIPRSGGAAWAHKPAIRKNRSNKNVLLICRFKAGASEDCLQAYAGGGSGLTKGKQ